MAGVRLEGLRKSYGAETVIDGVDVKVRDGEFLTLLGPSGCGKTTTLRIVAGFVAPDAGRVLFGGRDMTWSPPQRRNLGMVFQDYALFPHLTVAENVGFALRERGTPRGEIERRVGELLALVRLPGFGARYPAELSGGQQQRVALARALAHTPSVLLMDEPLGALDLKLREAMQAELYAIQRALRITTIYVTHDQQEALSLSDRIALMRRGRIVQLDTPARLYAAPRSPFVAYFLGKVNFLSGRVVDKSGGFYHVTVGGRAIRGVPGDDGDPLEPGAAVVLAVRPEHLRLSTGSPPDGHNTLGGRITGAKFFGNVVQYAVSVAADLTVLVDDPPGVSAGGVGSEVHVVWDPACTRTFRFSPDAELGLAEVRG